jgi:Flp pilus assembly protein TadG
MLRKFFTRKDIILQDEGAAAIEFAFIMPFMLLLYFGLVDVTGLISMNRRVVSAAATMADLVGQQKTTILGGTITDQYNAAYVIMQPVQSANVRVEIFDFRTNAAGAIVQMWKTGNNLGPSCGAAPDTTGMANLMTAGNDVIVARVCATYYSTVASFMGTSIMGAASFNLSQSISVRPRSSLTLDCYATTVAAATVCS